MFNIKSIIREVLEDHEDEINEALRQAVEDTLDIEAVIAAVQPRASELEDLILEVANDEIEVANDEIYY